MKRLDVDPTKEVLIESMKSNTTGRNDDIVQFIQLLRNTEGPYSYMVDAPWGDGKTFFLKSVELMLKILNPWIATDEIDQQALRGLVSKFECDDVSFLPFYFNAWENDFAEDPITALFANMAVELGCDDYLKLSKVKDGVTSVIDASLSLAKIPLSISSIVSAMDSKSLVKAYEERREVRTRIQQLAETSRIEVANNLVIFIDELDRYRPDFAVRLLEQSKSLFASESIVLVFATDSSQLAKAVGGMYGPGFDSSRFLERFFDQRLTMTPVDACDFVNGCNSFKSSNKFDTLVRELFSRKSLSIREAQRVQEKLDAARYYCLEGPHVGLHQIIASCTVLPLFVFMERENTELFRTITTGSDFDALYEYGKTYKSFTDNIKSLLARTYANSQASEKQDFTEEDTKSYMHRLCVAIYGSPSDPEYREAAAEPGGFFSVAFEAQVYKQLKFGKCV